MLPSPIKKQKELRKPLMRTKEGQELRLEEKYQLEDTIHQEIR
tara:strand:+ start:697 stop:825 length:129 start_codon:yes stop_codon:yes gene_type:complete